MLICDNGVIREMTIEEIRFIEHMPDPNADSVEAEEIVSILTGESE